MSSLFQGGALAAKGREGEDAAYRFLTGMSNVKAVEDVRAIRHWQEQEIDFRLHVNTGEVRGIEVQSDAHIEKTGNVLFELGRIHHTAPTPFYLGWGVFSKADWLLVYAPSSQVFRLFTFSKLRAAMQAYTQEARARANFKWITSDETRTTLNVLLPLSRTPHWVYRLRRDGQGWYMDA